MKWIQLLSFIAMITFSTYLTVDAINHHKYLKLALAGIPLLAFSWLFVLFIKRWVKQK